VLRLFTDVQPLPSLCADVGCRWPKGWGTPFDSFWCCYGTAVESFAKLADGVFFWRADDADEVTSCVV